MSASASTSKAVCLHVEGKVGPTWTENGLPDDWPCPAGYLARRREDPRSHHTGLRRSTTHSTSSSTGAARGPPAGAATGALLAAAARTVAAAPRHPTCEGRATGTSSSSRRAKCSKVRAGMPLGPFRSPRDDLSLTSGGLDIARAGAPPPASTGAPGAGVKAPGGAGPEAAGGAPAPAPGPPVPVDASIRAEVAYMERVRATCGMLNIGNVPQGFKERQDLQQAVFGALRTRAIYRANAFADDVSSYLRG